MPSINGGDSSGRDYAPHMYILAQGGDPRNDSAYEFVGDAVASAFDDEGQINYRMGVTVLGEIVCELSVYDPNQHRDVPTGIPFEAIPEAAKREMLSESLSQIATVSGHLMLNALGVEVPQDVPPVDFEKMFDGTPEEQAAEMAKSEQWDTIEQQLREQLGAE